MDDTQCRCCLADIINDGFSVWSIINGINIKEKLKILTGIDIIETDSLSKMICEKCYDICDPFYMFKIKCLETDRTLRNLEKKMKQKINELMKIEESSITFEDEEVKGGGNQEIEDIIVFEEFEALDETHDVEIEQREEQEEFLEEMNLEDLSENVIEEVEDMIENIDYGCTKDGQVEIGGAAYCCRICDFYFFGDPKKLEKQIKKHTNAHQKGKNFCCMTCSELFSSQKTLRQHKDRHHNSSVSSIKCKECKKEFRSVKLYENHQQKCNNPNETSDKQPPQSKTFKCYICESFFKRGIFKKHHVKTVHADKAGSDCPLCLRCKIPSAIAFENHYKTHFISPRFSCRICGKDFYESDRLQIHIKRFHNLSIMTCDHCGKEFRDKSGISRHILGVHLKRRDHQCKICLKSFTASYNLKEHLFSVHKQITETYSCNDCNKHFLYRRQFERHREKCDGNSTPLKSKQSKIY